MAYRKRKKAAKKRKRKTSSRRRGYSTPKRKRSTRKRKSTKRKRRYDPVWGNLKTEKQRQAALRRIARVNEEFFAHTKRTPLWRFYWREGGYNTVSARSRSEAIAAAERLGKEYGLRPDHSSIHETDTTA